MKDYALLKDIASLCVKATAETAAMLHPSTSPAAIAADQRQVVKLAKRQLGRKATAAAISEAVDLPVSVVERRLAELKRKVRRESIARA